MARRHAEHHRAENIGWLRAAVLGANDGIISVSSLVAGIAAAGADKHGVLLTGVAGLVSGALSMAAGEYVSVRSQADTEEADLAKERQELRDFPEREQAELTSIYIERGLDKPLARQVAAQLMANDALQAHARDELGITETLRARPLQAALASAAAFSAGAAVPVASVLLSPLAWLVLLPTGVAALTLLVLGGVAAGVGGAPVLRGALRVFFWGLAAMALTALVGRLFGASV